MAEKIKNPFIHSHDDDCDHGHHHHHEPFEPTDPAQKALGDAMHVSFMILKAIMFLMLVVYACTGIFTVQAQEQVVRLQFGKIVGAGDGQVYSQGWYVGWPYPIEEKVAVPIITRSVPIRKAFWYEVSGTDSSANPRGGPLNPEKDGSLLTGDANIVHGRFEVDYKVVDVIAFVENIGLVKPSDERYTHMVNPDPMAYADDVVASVAEQGIVYAAAQVQADDFIKGRLSQSAAVNRMQAALDTMNAGILIERLKIPQSEAPVTVKPAYNLVTNAESERGQKLAAARQQRTTLLNEAAGEAHDDLFELVQAYEQAQSAGQTEKAEQLLAVIDTAFDQLRMPQEYGGGSIGGEAARLISEANTYRTETVEQVKSEAYSFTTLLDDYRAAPKLFVSRESERTREAVFTGDVETLYNNAGQLYLEINTDPDIARKREQKRIEQEENDAYQRANQDQ